MMSSKQENFIERPYVNGYCEKCMHQRGKDLGSQYCVACRYLNCGQIIECGTFKEKTGNNK